MNKAHSNDAVTGAGGFVTVKGQTLQVSQPTDADFVLVRKYLHQMFVRESKSPLASIAAEIKDLPPHLQEVAIREAIAQNPSGAQPTKEALSELVYEPEGAAVLLWVLSRKHQPALTLEESRSLVDEDNVHDVLANMLVACDLQGLEKNSTGRTG